MSRKHEIEGARAAIEITIRELEVEEKLARRRCDSAEVALKLARGEQKPVEQLIKNLEWNLGFQKVRWEIWDAALRAARKRLTAKEFVNSGLAA